MDVPCKWATSDRVASPGIALPPRVWPRSSLGHLHQQFRYSNTNNKIMSYFTSSMFIHYKIVKVHCKHNLSRVRLFSGVVLVVQPLLSGVEGEGRYQKRVLIVHISTIKSDTLVITQDPSWNTGWPR